MSWIAVGVAVAGTLVKQYNTNKTAKKRDKFMLDNMAKQREHESQANARAQEEMNRLSEQLGKRDEEAQRSGDIRKQLARKQGMALAGMQATGGSEAVEEAIGQQSGVATDYGQFMADVLGRMDGPGERRRKDSYKHGDLNSYINKLKRHSGADLGLAKMGAASVRPNWLLSLLGEGLSAYGSSGMAGGGIGGGGGGGTSGFSNLASPQANYSDLSSFNLPTGSPMNIPPYQGLGIFGSGTI